ncbi:MAG TPA: prepilin-type N-terminal cleavage/methylation domain-containing protein [Gemmatimonadales bacterium]|nr:prepilin-type N-terminal cleavage/methylation domain-containing protein [Gemmatimonadales bacterium]
MKHANSGFTVVEVLVAVVLLGVGVMALVGSSAMTTRMIGRGKVETRAAQAASQRMETLRVAAHSTSPRCTSPAFASGGPVSANGITQSWVVPAAGKVRSVQVNVTYRTVGGTRTASLRTLFEC